MTRASAHKLLDLARSGYPVPESEVLFALWMTGDLFSTTTTNQHHDQEKTDPSGAA
jgi:hypothetical protein